MDVSLTGPCFYHNRPKAVWGWQVNIIIIIIMIIITITIIDR